MKKIVMLVAALSMLVALGGVEFWDKARLYKTPKTWEVEEFNEPGVKAIMIEGDGANKHETRFFAYYGLPEGASATNKVPGIVLVHGGGGTAFASWVRTWNKRGYAAIAMDNCGGLPLDRKGLGHLRHKYSAPAGWGEVAFPHVDKPFAEQWPYHAILSIIRSNSFLRSLPEVDASRIGVTGISWGGWLTSIVAGVDDRFIFAVPVYGCGFMGFNGAWKGSMDKMGERGKKWLAMWDPAVYLPHAKMPVMWCTGTNDHFYPLDALQKCYELLPNGVELCVRIRMPHGHPPAGDPKEITEFANHFAKGAKPLPHFTQTMLSRGAFGFAFKDGGRKIAKAELVYTTDKNPVWEKREYKSEPISLRGNTGKVSLPAGTVLAFVNLTTEDGFVVSSRHVTP